MDMVLVDMIRHQMDEFQNQRLFSIVIFENIPQIILQAIYLNIDGNFGGIALMALLFSVFSVIISIFEVSTKRYASKQQLTECKILSIKFDVSSQQLVHNRNLFIYQQSQINRKIAWCMYRAIETS